MGSYARFANTRSTPHRAVGFPPRRPRHVSKLSVVKRQVWQMCLRPRLCTQSKHRPDLKFTSQTVTLKEVCAHVSLTEHPRLTRSKILSDFRVWERKAENKPGAQGKICFSAHITESCHSKLSLSSKNGSLTLSERWKMMKETVYQLLQSSHVWGFCQNQLESQVKVIWLDLFGEETSCKHLSMLVIWPKRSILLLHVVFTHLSPSFS